MTKKSKLTLCTACCHPLRHEIETALRSGALSIRAAAAKYGLSKSALSRHKLRCLDMPRPATVLPPPAERDIPPDLYPALPSSLVSAVASIPEDPTEQLAWASGQLSSLAMEMRLGEDPRGATVAVSKLSDLLLKLAAESREQAKEEAEAVSAGIDRGLPLAWIAAHDLDTPPRCHACHVPLTDADGRWLPEFGQPDDAAAQRCRARQARLSLAAGKAARAIMAGEAGADWSAVEELLRQYQVEVEQERQLVADDWEAKREREGEAVVASLAADRGTHRPG